jgi:hypothetical protein
MASEINYYELKKLEVNPILRQINPEYAISLGSILILPFKPRFFQLVLSL